MTQYLVTTFKDSIGHVHPHVTAAKPNQTYQVVEADSKEEAEEMANKPKGLLEVIPSSFNNGPISKALKASIYRKDSE